MSSEGPYGRQGFQSNPSGYGGGSGANNNYSYGGGGGDQQPVYGGGQGYGGGGGAASYGAPPPQQGGYGGGMEYNPYGAAPSSGGGIEYEVRLQCDPCMEMCRGMWVNLARRVGKGRWLLAVPHVSSYVRMYLL